MPGVNCSLYTHTPPLPPSHFIPSTNPIPTSRLGSQSSGWACFQVPFSDIVLLFCSLFWRQSSRAQVLQIQAPLGVREQNCCSHMQNTHSSSHAHLLCPPGPFFFFFGGGVDFGATSYQCSGVIPGSTEGTI